jgi:hypothetical protein
MPPENIFSARTSQLVNNIYIRDPFMRRLVVFAGGPPEKIAM